jgi:hypothetical protein
MVNLLIDTTGFLQVASSVLTAIMMLTIKPAPAKRISRPGNNDSDRNYI